MATTFDRLFSLPEATPYDEDEDFVNPAVTRAAATARRLESQAAARPEILADPDKDEKLMDVFKAKTLDLPAHLKPKPKQTLESWLKENDPEVQVQKRIDREYRDKGIWGKIMMGIGEGIRGAQSGPYIPYSTRVRKEEMERFKAVAPVMTNELKLQQANAKLLQGAADKARDQDIKLTLGEEANRLRRITVEQQGQLISAKVKNYNNEYIIQDRKMDLAEVTQKQRKEMDDYRRGLAPGAAEDWFDAAYREVLREVGGDHTKVDDKEVNKRALKYISQVARDKARASSMGRRLDPNDPRNTYVGTENMSVYDLTTGRTREISARTLTNKMTAQVGYASAPDFNPEDLGRSLVKLSKEQAKEMDGFAKTLTNVNSYVGTLANAVRKGTAEQMVRAQENRMFEFIRAYREGEGYVLTAEEAALKPSLLNAVILHTRAMIGYRPPLQMITDMYEKINRQYGSVQAKVFSMISLKFLTEMAQYKTLGIHDRTNEIDQLKKVMDGAEAFTKALVENRLPPGSKVPSLADFLPGLPDIHGGNETSNRIGISSKGVGVQQGPGAFASAIRATEEEEK
jgi:hypothetical protein